MKLRYAFAVAAFASASAVMAQGLVVLDPAGVGKRFDGIGATSAGSSRLLIDYPEQQRAEILDYLFKPGFGAALQQLKIEIGGDGNSNSVAHPSYRHTQDDHDMRRGFEWWLAVEAKKRNPAIVIDALAWNFPGWVKAADSAATVDYLVDYVQGMKREHGIEIAHLGIWNETAMPRSFVPRLKAALRSKGLATLIVADDSVNSWAIADDMARDAALRDAVDVVATHYTKGTTPPTLQARSLKWGKPIWSSEDGPWDDAWGAWGQQSRSYAETLNTNYIGGRLTLTSLWSPVTAYPDNLGLPRSGLLRADTPWSGHYQVLSPIWVVAHTTQFAKPGWHYIDAASAMLRGGGSHVALTDGRNFSVVVETMAAERAQTVQFHLAGGVAPSDVHVWRTTATRAFERIASIRPRAGAFSYRFAPHAIYTLTTTVGQHKGISAPPPARPFPLPYTETFEGYPIGETNPRYQLAQNGAFEVARCLGRSGHCLGQVVTTVPIAWGAWGLSTEAGTPTLVGDPAWRDYRVSADVRVIDQGYAMIIGRAYNNDCDGPFNAYQFRLYDTGRWELHRTAKDGLVTSGTVATGSGGWHRLTLVLRGDRITGEIDGRPVFSVVERSLPSGMAGFGAGWNRAQFDNVRVERVAPDRPVIVRDVVPGAKPLLPPSISLPVVQGNTVVLKWSAVPLATRYRLWVADKGDGEPLMDLDLGRALSHRVTGLARGKTYFFKVTPVNRFGIGQVSYTQVATIDSAR